MKHKLLCGRLMAGALVVALSATPVLAPTVVFAEEINTSADETTEPKLENEKTEDSSLEKEDYKKADEESVEKTEEASEKKTEESDEKLEKETEEKLEEELDKESEEKENLLESIKKKLRQAKKGKLNNLDVDAISSATQSKFSSKVQFQSAKSYGGIYEDKFEAAAYLKTPEGEEEKAMVAVGYTFGSSEDPNWDFAANMEAYPKVGHSYNEAIIVCFDDERNVDWVWESDRVGVSYFLTVDVLEDGSIVAGGRCRDYESNRTAMYLVKINPEDPSDYTEYIINSPSGAGYEINNIVATSDGGFAVSGYTSFLEGYIASKKAGEEDFSEKTKLWQNADGKDEDVCKRASIKGYNGMLLKFDKDMELDFANFENYGVEEGIADPGYSSAVEKILGFDIDANGDYVTVGLTQLSKGNANAVISKWDGQTGELISRRMAGTNDPMKQNSIDLISASYMSVAALADGTYVVTGTASNDATTAEGWKCYGSSDVVVVRYSSDLNNVLFARNIGTVDGLSGSLTATNGTEMEGVKATADGGYVVFGTSNTTLVEKDLINEGYNWKNYGGNDGIIIKYDRNNNVSWCQNYGTTGGDWIYDVIIRSNETEITAVGQTSGQYGTPSWEWHGQAASSTNPFDAFVMSTNMYKAAYTESKASEENSGVTWANGVYEGEGVGRGGTLNVEVKIENNRIADIQVKSHNETPSVYERALSLLDTILKKQSTDVDSISGATLSSHGIKGGVSNALAKASAQTAINAIDKISKYTSANTSNTGNINNVLAAINYYTSLTDYEREYVINSEKLYEIADIFGFTVDVSKSSSSEKDEEILDDTLNDTYWNLQSKYYKQINANALLEHGLTGEGVKIAIVDSGIVGNSADLDYSHILSGWDYVTDSPINGREDLIDTQGHGTLVAGIIAAVRNNEIGIAGLLSGVDLVPIRIPSGTDVDTSVKVAQAIRDAVDKFDADVITTSVSLADTPELKAAVDYATSKGAIIVGASGNSGVSGSITDEYIYPASYDSVISVGAVDSVGTVRVNSTKNDKVLVVAPGQQIVSLGLSANGYKCYVKSGTSYSSPVVAAMAAAAKQKNGAITTEEFVNLLMNTSQDKGDDGYDNSYGYGLVDFGAFAEKVAPLSNPQHNKINKSSGAGTSTNSSSGSGNGSSANSSSGSSNSVNVKGNRTTETIKDETTPLAKENVMPDKTNKVAASSKSKDVLKEDEEILIEDTTTEAEDKEVVESEKEDADAREEVTEIPEEETPTAAEKKSYTMLIILLVIGIAAVAGGVRYLIISTVKNK